MPITLALVQLVAANASVQVVQVDVACGLSDDNTDTQQCFGIQSQNSPIVVTVGQMFEINLPVQLGWGGKWVYDGADAASITELVDEKVRNSRDLSTDGRIDSQTFVFLPKEAGRATLKFADRRVFVTGEPPRQIATFELYVSK